MSDIKYRAIRNNLQNTDQSLVYLVVIDFEFSKENHSLISATTIENRLKLLNVKIDFRIELNWL